MKQELNSSTSVAFTGHRAISSDKAKLSQQLVSVIRALYAEGFTTFLSGVAEGFDLLAAEAVLSLKGECPDIRLVAVVPYPGQAFRYSPQDRRRYRQVLEGADMQILIADEYHDKVFFDRNDFLVAHSSRFIAYYDEGQRSGTMYTVNRARRKGSEVINLF